MNVDLPTLGHSIEAANRKDSSFSVKTAYFIKLKHQPERQASNLT